jgi:hypothetical protein
VFNALRIVLTPALRFRDVGRDRGEGRRSTLNRAGASGRLDRLTVPPAMPHRRKARPAEGSAKALPARPHSPKAIVYADLMDVVRLLYMQRQAA